MGSEVMMSNFSLVVRTKWRGWAVGTSCGGEGRRGVEFRRVLFRSGIKRGAALDPGVDGVGGDDVELLVGGEHEVAGIVVDHLDARGVHHAVILFGAIQIGRGSCRG